MDVKKKYFLCNFCTKFLKDHPNQVFDQWIEEKGFVSKNIRTAHKLRQEEKSPWISKQPERLNETDHIVDANDMICESPNNANK